MILPRLCFPQSPPLVPLCSPRSPLLAPQWSLLTFAILDLKIVAIIVIGLHMVLNNSKIIWFCLIDVRLSYSFSEVCLTLFLLVIYLLEASIHCSWERARTISLNFDPLLIWFCFSNRSYFLSSDCERLLTFSPLPVDSEVILDWLTIFAQCIVPDKFTGLAASWADLYAGLDYVNCFLCYPLLWENFFQTQFRVVTCFCRSRCSSLSSIALLHCASLVLWFNQHKVRDISLYLACSRVYIFLSSSLLSPYLALGTMVYKFHHSSLLQIEFLIALLCKGFSYIK